MTPLDLEQLPLHCFSKSLRLLQELIDAKGGVVPYRRLTENLWPGCRRDRYGHLRSAVHNARKALRDTGWTVDVVNRVGYRLVRVSA